MSNLQKGTIWDYHDLERERSSSNEEAQENAKETQYLAEDGKGFGSPRASGCGHRISVYRACAQAHDWALLLSVTPSPSSQSLLAHL